MPWVRGFGTTAPNSAFGDLLHIQISFCSRDCTPTVSMPSKGLSIPIWVGVQHTLNPVTVAQLTFGGKESHGYMAHGSGGDE